MTQTLPHFSLGPCLFNWKPEKLRDFYFRIADEADVDCVHLGEVVCFKRAGLHAAVRGPRTVSGPVALVASELATNALRHGVPPATVTLSRLPAAYLLDVSDGAVDERPVLAARRPLGEGGFGLYLVGRLADDLGWYVAADRKHVWATIPH